MKWTSSVGRVGSKSRDKCADRVKAARCPSRIGLCRAFQTDWAGHVVDVDDGGGGGWFGGFGGVGGAKVALKMKILFGLLHLITRGGVDVGTITIECNCGSCCGEGGDEVT